MSILGDIARLFLSDPLQTRSLESFEFTPLGEEVKRIRGIRSEPWRLASIKDALGVPAIQRAVSLIANTTGSLTVQGLKDSMPMPEAPRILMRPDPFQTPREFYRDTAYYLATRGEAIWWIAARDGDGLPASLIVVPLAELTIEKDPRDRRFPIYRWGKTVSTRFAPIANLTGEFVHVTYLREPGELRGKGPLQMCGAAISVSVEAALWAANFFAGNPSTTELNSLVDIDGVEAKALKDQWMESGTSGLPRVTNPTMKWIDHQVDPKSAQMTEARTHQDGEAARMFGIPGSLLEYSAPGSSLTYQNIAEVFTNFVRSCLSINYLEPIEQALSDLLPRTTAARFNVEGLLRADIKTRFDVYESAVKVLGAEEGAQYAREREGLAPGNPEMAPTPFAFPAAIPTSFPAETRSQQLTIMESPAMRLADAMVALATREQPAPIVNNYAAPAPDVVVHPAQITFESGAFEAPDMRAMSEAIAGLAERPQQPIDVQVDVAAPDMTGVAEAMGALADRPQPPIEVTVEPAEVNVTTPEVHVEPPNVTFTEGSITSPAVTVEPANVTVNVPEPRRTRKKIKRDGDNNITEITEEPV
jgi:HK97 family phage portal protein